MNKKKVLSHHQVSLKQISGLRRSLCQINTSMLLFATHWVKSQLELLITLIKRFVRLSKLNNTVV